MTAPRCRCTAQDPRACLLGWLSPLEALEGEVCACSCHPPVPAGVPALVPLAVAA